MVGDTIVMSIELVGGTTLVLTIGALTAAASRLRSWIASRNPGGLRPVDEAAQPIAQVRAQIDPYRDAAGDALLADALDISGSELRTARSQAHAQILSHLLSEGLVAVGETREHTDQGYHLPGPSPSTATHDGGAGDEAIFLAFLAENLGITIGALQAAREHALEAALTLAVEKGEMTEAQMEDRLMRYRAQPYTDPGALLAEALDITLEELEEATLGDWLIRRSLTWRALTARLASAREDALDQAVTDGELNRAEADRLLAESVWAPLVDSRVFRFPTNQLPRYGFLYLHDADDILN